MKKLIDAYIYREVSNEIEFLILQRAENRIYAGQWRMVGGKVKQNEEYAHAALREIEEEVQLRPSFSGLFLRLILFLRKKLIRFYIFLFLQLRHQVRLILH